METKTGTITTIHVKKTYGFIKQNDGGKDMFFHKMGVISPEFEQLREGMNVEYMVVESRKGERAIGLVVA